MRKFLAVVACLASFISPAVAKTQPTEAERFVTIGESIAMMRATVSPASSQCLNEHLNPVRNYIHAVATLVEAEGQLQEFLRKERTLESLSDATMKALLGHARWLRGIKMCEEYRR